MSRYVDLDGKTWDGTPIASKIQEVQTKHGYMSGITVGWLWGDNVPHIDLEEHDAKVRADTIEEVLCKMWQLYEHEERTIDDLRVRRFCNKLAEQLKG